MTRAERVARELFRLQMRNSSGPKQWGRWHQSVHAEYLADARRAIVAVDAVDRAIAEEKREKAKETKP